MEQNRIINSSHGNDKGKMGTRERECFEYYTLTVANNKYQTRIDIVR